MGCPSHQPEAALKPQDLCRGPARAESPRDALLLVNRALTHMQVNLETSPAGSGWPQVPLSKHVHRLSPTHSSVPVPG